MKTPTTLFDRPGRVAAVVGAVVAISAATLMAVVAGTASATVPGRCVDTVNVRAQPRMDAEIVAVCEAGTETEVGETRNGFVRMIELRGWSAQEFVSVDGAEPGAARTDERNPVATVPAETADGTTDSDTTDSDTTDDGTTDSDTTDSDTTDSDTTDSDTTDSDTTDSDTTDGDENVAPNTTEAPAPATSPLDGLLP